MAYTPEPTDLSSEVLFVDALFEEVRAILSLNQRSNTLGEGEGFLILREFGFDIGVFLGSESRAGAKFIEGKIFAGNRRGAVGFGNSRGCGPQVEVLRNEGRRPKTVDSSIIWTFADALEPTPSRYRVFTCTDAMGLVMGQLGGVKQHNFNVSKIRRLQALTWDGLSTRLERFLCSSQ